MLRIFTGGRPSNGATRLAQALGIRRIRANDSRYVARPDHHIINWGSTIMPAQLLTARVLNTPSDVAVVANKLSFFRAVPSELVPPFTTRKADTRAWIRDGDKVVARTVLNGSGGRGIHIAAHNDEVVEAPLYVKYIPKTDEYRVHVFRRNVIDVQRKARRQDHPNPNWEIRNHENGFIFAREGINPPPQVLEVSLEVMRNLHIDFGAVDVVWNKKLKRAYVLEVNSAPGLEGQTVTSYADAFRSYL